MVPDQQVIVTVNPSSAKVHILCVSEDILSEPFREAVSTNTLKIVTCQGISSDYRLL